jgi:hypothetical protein
VWHSVWEPEDSEDGGRCPPREYAAAAAAVTCHSAVRLGLVSLLEQLASGPWPPSQAQTKTVAQLTVSTSYVPLSRAIMIGAIQVRSKLGVPVFRSLSRWLLGTVTASGKQMSTTCSRRPEHRLY